MPAECVRVMVRCRPMNKKEMDRGSYSVMDFDEKARSASIKDPDEEANVRQFTYDAVFREQTAQSKIYETSTFPIQEAVFNGYNGTVFAYGQTGCGKSHTMMGNIHSDSEKGIIPRTFSHMLSVIESNKASKQYLIRVSFIEIYNEMIHDLLGVDVRAKMSLHESPDHGVYIKDLTLKSVKVLDEMYKWLDSGNSNRSVGATAMNQDSSRSHSIFTIHVETSEDIQGEDKFTAAKLNMVDLAGSERQSKTHATGDRLAEANKINLSLSALGNVISALVDGKSKHIPYRVSKLTRLLQDSLGGNTKTVMIANISPADYNYDETQGTLRYAARAKQIKNKPVVNEDPKDALLKEYADEIRKLKELLSKKKPGIGDASGSKSNRGRLGSHTLEQGIIDIEDLKKIERLRQLEAEENDKEAKKQEIENKLKNKDDALKEELEKQEKLQKLLDEMENKAKLKKKGSQLNSHFDIAKEKDYRDKMLKQQVETSMQYETLDGTVENEADLDEQIITAQVPKDVKNMKQQYELLAKKYKQKEFAQADAEKDNNDDKFDLIDQIRDQRLDVQYFTKLILSQIPSEDIERLRLKSKWQDSQNKFSVPGFMVNKRKMTFPKIQKFEILNNWESIKMQRYLQMDFDNLINDNQFLQIKEDFNKSGGSRSSHKRDLSPNRPNDSFRENVGLGGFPKFNEPTPYSHRGVRNHSANSRNDSFDFMRNEGNSKYSEYEVKGYYMDSDTCNNLGANGNSKPMDKNKLAPLNVSNQRLKVSPQSSNRNFKSVDPARDKSRNRNPSANKKIPLPPGGKLKAIRI